MKRRRILSDGEEEEEEDRGRRDSLRIRKKICHRPSILQSHDGEDIKLPVTCGFKTGFLDVEKLAQGGDCILCEGQWFCPPAFEAYAGKPLCRKWKTTISYKGKPLKTLFDNGMLTAKSYRGRKSSTRKPKKILPSDVESDSSPGGLFLDSEESEEEVHTIEEEEDKTEEGKTEDESEPAVTDEDNNNVCEDMKTDLIMSTRRKNGARVLLKRLKKGKTECQSSCPELEHPEESWCMPLDDDMQNEEESQHNDSARDDPYTAATQTDTSWMSAFKNDGEESGERKDGQTEIQTKTRKPARPLSAPATSSKPEDTQSPVSETSTSLASGMKDHCEERGDGVFERFGKKDKEQPKKERLETSVQPPAAQSINESSSETKCTEPMSRSPKPLSEQADNPAHTDATTNDHEAAQIQMMNQETSDPQTTHSSDMEEVSSSRCSVGINLDTMDLQQLKKEKIKMQIKVLKLQEEYYTMKIQGFRK